MALLIGICGAARSGKDTVANMLVQHEGFDRYSFADPVKKTAQQMFGLTEEETWSDERKDEMNDFWGITHRKMFQDIGTEGGRMLFFDDIWIRRALKEIENRYGDRDDYRLVIPDVRFDNEAHWIHEMGGILLHIVRTDAQKIDTAGHASENSLDYKLADYTLVNDSSLDRLRYTVRGFMKMIQNQ